MNEKINNPSRGFEGQEIDLFELLKKLWLRRNLVIGITVVCLFVGVLVAFLSPKEYTAQCVMGLQNEDKTMRISFVGAPALEGMNVGDKQGEGIISPNMYSNILFSVPFLRELVHAELELIPGRDSVSFYDYCSGAGDSELESDRKSSGSIQMLTSQEEKCMTMLKNDIDYELKSRDGYMTISVTMQEPRLAAQLTQKIQILLQEYIINYKVAKARASLDFIQERYVEARHNLELKQEELVTFRETYKGNQVQTREKILNNEYDLFFNLYSDLLRQLEKAKIRVKETMPVLTVIEPVVMPTSPAKPQRMLICLASAGIGLILGCVLALILPVTSGKKQNN